MRAFFPALAGILAIATITAQPTVAQRSISCSSDNGKRHYCDVDTRGGVSMVHQRSDTACQEGYSWDYDRRGIWVDHGCRADFTVNSTEYGAPPPVAAERLTLTCASEDGRRHYCPADTLRGVRMFRQQSHARCTEGYSWGFDRSGIWVDHGCRADFRLHAGIR